MKTPPLASCRCGSGWVKEGGLALRHHHHRFASEDGCARRAQHHEQRERATGKAENRTPHTPSGQATEARIRLAW
jgi:hypothetical protein